MSCKHMNFDAQVGVARLEDSGRFSAEIRVHCVDCGKPFQFLGLEPGCNLDGANVSMDGLEARIAICPEGARPNPFHKMVHGTGKFDA